MSHHIKHILNWGLQQLVSESPRLYEMWEKQTAPSRRERQSQREESKVRQVYGVTYSEFEYAQEGERARLLRLQGIDVYDPR